jgi:hypothetical protein
MDVVDWRFESGKIYEWQGKEKAIAASHFGFRSGLTFPSTFFLRS